jgi:predicted metal-dependent HD superfamily phosphohydrolase
MSSHGLTLERRWQNLCRALAPATSAPDIDRAFAKLQQLYALPPREYHTLAHIESCLQLLDDHRSLAGSVVELETALWFHDAVYDARSDDNEARSADAAEEMLRRLDVSPDTLFCVRKLILATRHRDPPADCDEALIMDIDLAILAAPADQYDSYVRAVRQEYSFVGERDWRNGRLNVLRRFVERASVYHTDTFRQTREPAARSNMEHEIALLSSTG